MSAHFSYFLLVVPLVLSACMSDGKQPSTENYEQPQLIGRWELVKAWRNEKPTETMVGTYYEFQDDGWMKTNLTPTALEETYEYKFQGATFEQLSQPPILFSIDTLTSNNLSIRMNISNYAFRLELQRAQLPATPQALDSTARDSVKEL